MGIFDTVIGETTKWLLRKADKLLSKPKPTYKNKAEMLYEILCKVDDKISILKKTLFHHSGTIEIHPIGSTRYSRSTPILQEIDLWLKQTKEWYSDEYWYDIVLHSKRDKEFWDDLRQYLVSFESEIHEFHRIIMYYGHYFSLSEGEESHSYEKKEVIKQIQTFNWDCDKILQKYINALKDDISFFSIDDKKET